MMKIETREDLKALLEMSEEEFRASVVPEAQAVLKETKQNKVRVTAMMGYTNICKNMCLYCGMRAGNSKLPRYRIPAEDIIRCASESCDLGFKRLFLVAGEDPLYKFDDLLTVCHALKEKGMFISLACGEFEKSQYEDLRAAGVDEYVLKFEMSHEDSFNRLNPSTTFEKRMKAIHTIKDLGFRLASGNIVDWPGQSQEELIDDIMLMKELEISWAPIIPYMPALGTPLAAEGKRGEMLTIYKEIAALRLMMPDVNITAQQPGADLRKGLSDPDANVEAIKVGANVLFFDLLPDPTARNFRVIDDRNISGTSHIYAVAERGYELDKGEL